VKMAIELAMAETTAMMRAAGVSRSHVGLLVQAAKMVASGAAAAAEASRVMMAMADLPTVASDPAKLSLKVLSLAEEVLGKEVVQQLLDGAVDMACEQLQTALRTAGVPKVYLELSVAMGAGVGSYVLQHGPAKLASDVQSVVSLGGDIPAMQRELVAMCERVLGPEQYAKALQMVAALVASSISSLAHQIPSASSEGGGASMLAEHDQRMLAKVVQGLQSMPVAELWPALQAFAELLGVPVEPGGLRAELQKIAQDVLGPAAVQDVYIGGSKQQPAKDAPPGVEPSPDLEAEELLQELN